MGLWNLLSSFRDKIEGPLYILRGQSEYNEQVT